MSEKGGVVSPLWITCSEPGRGGLGTQRRGHLAPALFGLDHRRVARTDRGPADRRVDHLLARSQADTRRGRAAVPRGGETGGAALQRGRSTARAWAARRKGPLMCRWNGYFGQPVLMDELLFRPSTASSIRAFTRAWAWRRPTGTASASAGTARATSGTPARYRSVTPAWSDANLRDLASHIESPLFLAHIRATTGNTGAADQLPPVPARALAVRAQRRHKRVPQPCGASCCTPSTPRCSTASPAPPTPRRCSISR